MNRLIIGLLSVLMLLTVGGCSLDKIYVQADRDTHDVIAPSHRKYVEDDPNLTDEQKERRYRLLESWNERIKAAEEK